MATDSPTTSNLLSMEDYNQQLSARRAQLEQNQNQIQQQQFVAPVLSQKVLRAQTATSRVQLNSKINQAQQDFEAKKQSQLGTVQNQLNEQKQLEDAFAPKWQDYQTNKQATDLINNQIDTGKYVNVKNLDPAVASAYNSILKNNPDAASAIKSSQAILTDAKLHGFNNIQEYISVGKALGGDQFEANLGKQVALSTGQLLPDDLTAVEKAKFIANTAQVNQSTRPGQSPTVNMSTSAPISLSAPISKVLDLGPVSTQNGVTVGKGITGSAIQAPQFDLSNVKWLAPSTIPSVSAQSLNNSGGLINNGFSNITGNVIGASSGISSQQRNPSVNLSYFDRLLGATSQTFKQDTGQSFVSAAQFPAAANTGGVFFQSTPGVAVGSSTPLIRNPTTTEQAQIQAGRDFSLPQYLGKSVESALSTRLTINPSAGGLNQPLLVPTQIPANQSIIGLNVGAQNATVPNFGYLSGGTTVYTNTPNENTTRQINKQSSIEWLNTQNNPNVRQVQLAEQAIGTPEQFGKATEFIAANAPYAIPYVGEGLILGQAGYDAAPKIKKEGFVQGLQSFAQEHPGEALASVGVLGLRGLQLGNAVKEAATPYLQIERNNVLIPSVEPNLFVKPTSVETWLTPEGNPASKSTFSLSGAARQGTEVSAVRVLKTTSLRDWVGLKPQVVYDSLEPGLGVQKDWGLLGNPSATTDYQTALKGLQEQGYTSAQAKAMLRQYSRSPANIKILGQGTVVEGLTPNPHINFLGSSEFTPKITQIPKSGAFTRSFEPFKIKTTGVGEYVGARNDLDVSLGNTQDLKVYFGNSPINEYNKISQAGKTTTRSIFVGGSKQIGTANVPFNINENVAIEKPFDVYRAGTVSRRVVPNQRGLTQGLANVYVSKEEPGFKMDYGQPIKAEPTISEATKPTPQKINMQQLVSDLRDIYGKEVAKFVPPVNEVKRVPSAGLTVVKTSTVPTSTLPSVSALTISGLDIGPSQYAGKGQYEVTNVGGLMPTNTRDNSIVGGVNAVSPNFITGIKPNVSPFFTTSIGTKVQQNNDFGLGLGKLPATGFNFNFDTNQNTDTSQGQSQEQSQEQATVQATAQQTAQTTINVPRIVQIQRPREPPRLTPTGIPKLKKPDETNKRKYSKVGDAALFIPEVKRHGKFIELSKPVSLGLATDIAKRKTLNTLAASFGIKNVRTGQFVKLNDVSPLLFRPAKRTPNVYVQRTSGPGNRLASFGERMEIKATRRRGKRNLFGI